ncbi:MAG: polysaccharide deacetylase family protein [Actinobacteria bacterium]|nr:polysaccharide deacetylase family protein [Actinomycetota bacterium]
MPPRVRSAPAVGRAGRWREGTGIPVEATFVRAYAEAGGPARLGYPITPGLYRDDVLAQYCHHGRLEAAGHSAPVGAGQPRLAPLGRIMARGVLGPGALRVDPEVTGEFARPWQDPARRALAGPAVTEPVWWRGVLAQWFERDIVRLLPIAPSSARPVAGPVGELFAGLPADVRARGDGRPSPIARTVAPGEPVVAPILTYHLTRTAAEFRAQLGALLQSGFTPVTLDHLVAAVEGWAFLPARPFVVTFDDGWAVQLDGALPVLVELGVPGTFFVMPGFNRYGQGHMTIDDFRVLRTAGMTVASHTVNHADLPALLRENRGAAEAEVIEARLILEREIDGVDYFAYPSGFFNDAVVEVVRAGAYRAAVSTIPGVLHTRDRLMTLRRVAVQAWWSAAQVRDAMQRAAGADGVAYSP